MRRAVVIALLAFACGRVGFAPIGGQADGATSPSDAAGSAVDASASEIDAPACIPCDVFSDCGCSAAEACYADTTPTCAPPGDLADGSDCIGNEQCVPQSLCANLGSSSHGVCTALCRDGSDCGSGAGACLNLTNTTGFGACEEICDPVANAGCGSGDVCFLIGETAFPGSGSVTASACGTLMSGLAAGSACGSPLDCAPQVSCVSGTCRPLCYVGSGSACTSPATCHALSPTITRAGHQVGICQ